EGTLLAGDAVVEAGGLVDGQAGGAARGGPVEHARSAAGDQLHAVGRAQAGVGEGGDDHGHVAAADDHALGGPVEAVVDLVDLGDLLVGIGDGPEVVGVVGRGVVEVGVVGDRGGHDHRHVDGAGVARLQGALAVEGKRVVRLAAGRPDLDVLGGDDA